MPLNKPETHGTNAGGSKSNDYCQYCYEDGAFTQNCTIDEMIEVCVPHMVAATSGLTEDKARNIMKAFFPALKRWK
jgi:hypothetical protein